VNNLTVLFNLEDIEAERAAMLLSISRTPQEEEEIKKKLRKIPGIRFAVTEIGGVSEQIHSKISAKLLGTALNNGVITKDPGEVHALMHAALEAERGVMLDIPKNASLALKVTVVAKDGWLAVAIFGQSAMHVLTNHWRAGLGVMHFPR
jgi:hut operon positive regulator